MVTVIRHAYTPYALDRFYAEFEAVEPKLQWGGTFATKGGYHNLRRNHVRGINGGSPNDYSIRLSMDREGSDALASAIDLSFEDARELSDFRTIAKYSNRLYLAMKNKDPRLWYKGRRVVREFFGNIDLDRNVEGWTLCSTDGCVSRAATSDISHLWHIHISFHRWVWALPDPWQAIKGILDILLGKPISKSVLVPVQISESLEEMVIMTGLPAKLVRVTGKSSIYAVTLKGVEHIKNPTHLDYLQAQGWVEGPVKDISQWTFDQLNEKES